MAIAQALLATGARVVVYDPAAMENAKRVLTGDVIFADERRGMRATGGCAGDHDAVGGVSGACRSRPSSAGKDTSPVLDCWRVLPEQIGRGIEHYMTAGQGGKPGYFSAAAGLEKHPREVSTSPAGGRDASGYNRVASGSIMTSATGTITQVHDYWNARPCNIRHSTKPVGTREYFDEVEARKYLVESHIPGFADFQRWKGKKVLEIGCGIGTDTINFARARSAGHGGGSDREIAGNGAPAGQGVRVGGPYPVHPGQRGGACLHGAGGALRSGVLVRRDSPHAASGEGAGRDPQVRDAARAR